MTDSGSGGQGALSIAKVTSSNPSVITGTLLTNDFRACHPRGAIDLDPISLICKVTAANGRPAVKLSDNDAKPTGPPAEVERYRQIFGRAGVTHRPVLV